MGSSTQLALAFGGVLLGGLLLTSGIRNRSLGDVLHGVTSAQASQQEAALGGEPGYAGGPTGKPVAGTGGTAGDQKTFGNWLAAYTGLDRGVIEKWLLAEQPPGSPATPGSNNWLNVQYTDSGPNAEYFRIARLPPQQAAAATATWMRRNQPSILAAAGKPAGDQEAAIVGSGWASSHYGGHL